MIKHVSSIVISVAIFVLVSAICFSFDKSDIGRSTVAQTVNNNTSISMINLNAIWEMGDNNTALIQQSNTNLTIYTTDFDHPSVYGSILNDSTITIIFPDNQSYIGKLIAPDR